MGRRRAATPGAQLDDLAHPGGRQASAQALGETQAVGILANPVPTAEQDRVDRPHPPRILAELVEQRDHRLLEGIGDVETGKTHCSGGFEHALEIGLAKSELGEIEKPVDQPQFLCVGLALMEKGRPRAADIVPEQSDQQPVRPGLLDFRTAQGR